MHMLCISCRCHIERVEIAGGRIVAICVACDAYGDAAELVAGVRMAAAQPLPPRLRVVHSQTRAKTAQPAGSAAPQPSRVKRRAAAGTR